MENRDRALELFQENLLLAHWTVDRYYPHLTDDEDMHQEAQIGLWKACCNYNGEKAKFSTFAVTCVRNEIRMKLRKGNKGPTLPNLSLDAPIAGEEDSCFLDFMVDEKSYLDESGIYLKDFIDHLNERELAIIQCRWEGLKQEEAAKRLGVSQSYYSRMLQTLWKKYQRYQEGKL